ncbi:MAG: sensor histidine kinase [Pleurocapsa sp. MO_226.B13]|nr:sensor histidine kinase [Pleurocapsa sp. MO_226.B13]
MTASSILPSSQTFPSIRRTIFYLEWTILLVHIVASFIGGFFYGNQYVYIENAYVITSAALVFFALLSFSLPLNRPLWQRRAYIFLEILCLILTCILTTTALDLLLYLVIAKSCFLLSRQDTIKIAIATGIIWQICRIWDMENKIEWLGTIIPEVFSDPQRYIIYIFFENTVAYLAGSTFIILLCFIFLAERKSHAKAVFLRAEVEKLAAKLERTRIARDIHDSLGHILTSLNIQLEVAARMEQHDPTQAKQALKTAKTLASQAVQEVKLSVNSMREENFNLDRALMNLVQQFQENSSYKIQARFNFPILPLQTSHQIYCIVQEGLTNIQKHSKASLVRLYGETTPEQISLKIADNGIGFEPHRLNSGFGLRGMQERVQMLGGQIKIDSRSRKGTQIQVKIPLGF